MDIDLDKAITRTFTKHEDYCSFRDNVECSNLADMQ